VNIIAELLSLRYINYQEKASKKGQNYYIRPSGAVEHRHWEFSKVMNGSNVQ
jgi:hypothetical protein